MQTGKDNIVAPVLEGPKIVGKINLDAVVPAKKQFHLLGNFPIKHLQAVIDLAKKANKNLKALDAITVSKVAKRDDKEDPTSGSIWFSCEKKTAITEFGKPLALMLVEQEHNCRRITREDMLNMPYGQNFYMAYLFSNNHTAVSPCVKIYTTAKENKKGISFTRMRDQNQNANLLAFEHICDNGTFAAENAEGYLFVSNETVTNDL